MANVIRLVNGGAIQVRTGVLAGVGPVGPRGPRGLAGPEGPQGPPGDTGPAGAISQYQARANITAPTSLTANTETHVAFQSVEYDDMGVFTSTINMTIPEDGDYMINAWCQFALPAGAASGTRRLSVFNFTDTVYMWRSAATANTTVATIAQVNCTLRATAGTVYRIRAFQSDDETLSITDGACVVTRVGSGPRGLQGATGPQGPAGATGPQGPAGPAGNAGTGYTTYGAIDGA